MTDSYCRWISKWPLWKVLAITIGTAGAFGGIEAALILTIRVSIASLYPVTRAPTQTHNYISTYIPTHPSLRTNELTNHISITKQPIYKSGNETPLIVIGVVAAILLAAGLLPPYAEAWKRRGRIIGINFLFLTIDSLGALFSLFSLVAQHTFDVLGGVMYIIWYDSLPTLHPYLLT